MLYLFKNNYFKLFIAFVIVIVIILTGFVIAMNYSIFNKQSDRAYGSKLFNNFKDVDTIDYDRYPKGVLVDQKKVDVNLGLIKNEKNETITINLFDGNSYKVFLSKKVFCNKEQAGKVSTNNICLKDEFNRYGFLNKEVLISSEKDSTFSTDVDFSFQYLGEKDILVSTSPGKNSNFSYVIQNRVDGVFIISKLNLEAFGNNKK